MMFLDCPAWLNRDGAERCGLPAEVSCRFTMRSTDGPVESAMIRCPAGHYFCGAIESLTWDGKDKHDPGSPAVTSRARRVSVRAAVMTQTDPTSGMTPPGRTRISPGPTPLRPPISAALRACGSASCARAAGAPHPLTRCQPSLTARNRPARARPQAMRRVQVTGAPPFP